MNVAAQLREHLDRTAPIAARAADLTVGVEHELFLDRADGAPADHDDSQGFFEALARRTGWAAHRSRWPGRRAPVVACVGGGPRGLVAVKYEHHPHLLEVATSPAPGLAELADELDEVLHAVDGAASEAGVRAVHRPFASVPPGDPRLYGEMALGQRLRAYRTRVARAEGRVLDRDALNFSAGIASTQVHVGGLAWWRDDACLAALYAAEPECVAVGISGAACDPGSLLPRRWRGYFATLPRAPLVGFPRLDAWSFEGWVSALAASPHLVEPAPRRLDAYLASARDLQLIRPRLGGTIEFRGDPAQADLSAILRLAGLRLGLASAVLRGWRPERSFVEAGRAWYGAVHDGAVEPPDRVLAVARAGLRERGFGEEAWLEARSGRRTA